MSPCRAAPEVTRRGPNPRARDPAIASLQGVRVIFCVFSIKIVPLSVASSDGTCSRARAVRAPQPRTRLPLPRCAPVRLFSSNARGAFPDASSGEHAVRRLRSRRLPHRAAMCHLRAKNEKEASNPSIAGSLPARRAPERGKGPRRARGPGADVSPPTEPAIQRAHRLTRLPPVSSPRVAPFSIAFLVRFPSRRASSAETRAR